MSEIVQRVVEKIEIEGDKEMVAGLDRVAGSAQRSDKAFDDFLMTIAELNDRMSAATKALEKGGEKTDVAGQKIEQGGEKGSKGMKGLFGTMFKANLAALLVEKGLGLVLGKLTALGYLGWNSAKAIDQMTGDVQGLSLALFDLGEGSPMEHFEKSGKIAEAVMRKMERIAFRASTNVREISHGFSEASGHLAPLGFSMDRILGLVEKNAAAAKVLGDNGEMSIMAITNAISSGTLAGKKGLPAALKGMVGDLSKMKPEERIKKIESALEKIGAPLDKVSQGPEEGFERMGIVASRVLGRIVLPLYDRVGNALGRIANWLDAQDEAWEKLAADAEDAVYSVFRLGEGVWNGVVAFGSILDKAMGLSTALSAAYDTGMALFSAVELIGIGWDAAAESYEVFSDPDRGLGRLAALSEAISIKWYEIADTMMLIGQKIARFAVPDIITKSIEAAEKLAKLAGIESVESGAKKAGSFWRADFVDDLRRDLRGKIAKKSERLAVMEKTQEIDPLTNETRRLRRAALADAKGLLAGLKGAKVKVEQNIGKIEITQDFRNQDPDRVLVEFVHGLERLGEAAIQSTVGGQATVYEGGL